MFDRESRWIAGQLALHPPVEISPLLDVGSSTSDFRERTQPWIAGNIFTPLAARGIEVVHLDTRIGAGIDIRGDLLDDDDFARLSASRYRALLCCNILEHVRDPGELARRCVRLVTRGGIIVATAPYSYPRHADPIDTLYRPTPQEMAALFDGADLLAGEIIDVGESYRDEVRRRPWILLRHLARLPFPFLDAAKWRASMQKPYWLLHPYRVSAAVLRRGNNG